ncbi:MAG: Rpn family recombination-promoting nuclease/putative transposase [Opitutaceae bacterium]|nr:Rpn family recombination-promoting nuclease/putative transposase [Opitutaceae bacterium]
MPEDRLHQPHDKLTKSSFEDKETAVAFFRQHLPSSIVRLILWSSLTHVPSSYIDERLRASESDRLYRVALHPPDPSAPSTEAFLFLLFEHQRIEDRWIAFRLLTYQLRIWEQFRSAHPNSQTLPPIIPIVLAQNNQTWTLSPRFHALFDLPTEPGNAEPSALSQCIPDFTFRLIQLSELPFDKITGTVLGILTLRVLKAEQTGDLMSDHVWDEKLLLRLSPRQRECILSYILGVGEVDKTSIDRRMTKLKNATILDAAMTLADQYRQEGREQAMTKAMTLADQYRQEGREQAMTKAMTLADQYRQEGIQQALAKAATLADQHRQEGQEMGRVQGQLIGKIQLLQDLLGREITPIETLASRSLDELQALHNALKAALL